MSQVPQAVHPVDNNIHKHLGSALGIIATGLLAVIAAYQTLWVGAAILGALLVYALARWPEASTLTVIFILYSNASAVAVEFHGIPFVLGASFFVLLIIPLTYYIIVRREKIVFPKTLVLMLLLASVRLIGALNAKHPDLAMNELFTLVIEGAVLYFLIINVVRSRETLRRAIWSLVFAGMFISVAPLYQQATGNFDNNLWGFGQVSDAAFFVDAAAHTGLLQPRLAGSIGEQNRYAQVMLMLFPLALFRWWSESHLVFRLLAVLGTILITLAVVLTFSRGAAVGMISIVLVMTALHYIRFRHLSLVILGIICLLVAVPQYGTRMAKLNGLWAMMDSSAGTADGSLKSRFTEMGAAGLVYLDNPLIGVGPGMFRYHYREYAERIGLRIIAKGRGSHSLYLGLAAETGTFGLVLFCSVVLITLRDLIRFRRRWKESRPEDANVAASFVLVIVAYLSTAFFLHGAYIRFFWLLMALAYAASHLASEQPNENASPSTVPT